MNKNYSINLSIHNYFNKSIIASLHHYTKVMLWQCFNISGGAITKKYFPPPVSGGMAFFTLLFKDDTMYVILEKLQYLVLRVE